ncbi:MAG: hypothetical protein ACMXYD_03675 [Candidatus Woesearchaeota archaeon]
MDTKKYTLTSTQRTILTHFCAHITKRFSLRETAKALNKHPALIHRASQELIKKGLIEEKKGGYSLNYKKHHQEHAYTEHIRSKEFLNKHPTLTLLRQDIAKKLPASTLIVFGSAVTTKNPRDIDILLITQHPRAQQILEQQLAQTTIPADTITLSFENIQELKTHENSILQQILNKHIILYGAELFYQLIS